MSPSPGSAEDTVLSRIISAVSTRMQSWMDRIIAQTTYTSEVHSGAGWQNILALNNYPFIGTPTIAIDGDSVSSDDLLFHAKSGLVEYIDVWPGGFGNITATYDAGYATTPTDIQDACITECMYEYKMQRKGDRIGETGSAAEAGGTSKYLVDAWQPQTLATMRR